MYILQEYSIVRGRDNERYVDKNEIRRHINRWHPLVSDLLARTPGERGVPLICVGEFSSPTLRSYRLRLMLSGTVFLAFSFAAVYFSSDAKDTRALQLISTVAAAIATLSLLEFGIFSDTPQLRLRAAFISEIIRSRRTRYSCFVALCVACFLVLIYVFMSHSNGGIDVNIQKFGFHSGRISIAGLLSAAASPLIHGSIFHLIGNIFLLGPAIIFSSYFWQPWKVLFVFWLGSVLSLVAQAALIPQLQIVVGISGGIFALIGMSIAFSIAVKLVPRFIIAQIITFAFVSSIASLLFSNSAQISHIFGLIFGLIIGFLCKPQDLQELPPERRIL